MTKTATTRRRDSAENDGTQRLAQWLKGRGRVTDGEVLVRSLLALGGRPLLDSVAAEVGIEAGGFLGLLDAFDERLRKSHQRQDVSPG